MRNSTRLGALSFLLATLLASPGAVGIEPIYTPRIEATSDGVSVIFALREAPPGTILDVTVHHSATGAVFHARAPRPRIEWVPQAAQGDGAYHWEAYAVLPSLLLGLPRPEDRGTRKAMPTPATTLTSGRFRMSGGVLESVDTRPSSRRTMPGRGPGAKSQTVLDSLEIAGASPLLLFHDTSDGTLWDVVGDEDGFDVNQLLTISGDAALFSLNLGAPNAAGDAEVGIGTTVPARNLEIQSESPSLLFDETDVGLKYQLGIRGGDFRYQDIGTLTIPMRIEHGAPHDSLFVENTGDLGLGTSSPTAALHIADGSPEISLQDTDDGQTWVLRNQDLEGSNFQVFDPGTVTRPFQIAPGAPNNTLYLAGSGRVGIGENSPQQPLHVRADPGGGNGVGIMIENTAAGQRWNLFNTGDLLLVDESTDLAPLFVAQGAPNRALNLDASGRVGFGTSNPVDSLHVRAPNAGLTLEDTLEPRQWHFLNNAGALTVYHDTGAPFIIGKDAPNNALRITGEGRVGLGTNQPAATLHVTPTAEATGVFIEDPGGPAATRQLLTLANNGPVEIGLVDTGGQTWHLGTGNGGFGLRRGSGAIQVAVKANGDVQAEGTLTEGSSITVKENIAPIDEPTVLRKLGALPLSEWNYIGDGEDRHLGPMAEDFHALFGLGPDDRHIAPKDLAGVALAAAKALRAEVRALRAENDRLRERVSALNDLRKRVERLEREAR